MFNKLIDFFSIKSLMNDCANNADTLHEITSEEREQLQECLVSILSDISEVCQKYNLKPFLQGGSLLGLIRHNGFIPWDDDIDLGMSRYDYEYFKKIFDQELGDRYILCMPNYKKSAVNRFAQIFKKGTIYEAIGSGGSDAPNNIYIDIFPIDFAPNNKILRCIKGLFCNFIMIIASQVEFYYTYDLEIGLFMGNSTRSKINIKLRLISGKLFSFLSYYQWFNIVDKFIIGKKSTNYCTSATGRKHYLGEIVQSTVFYPLKKAIFENVQIYIPNNSHLYLENLYGDYMKVPDAENREQHFVKKIGFSNERGKEVYK